MKQFILLLILLNTFSSCSKGDNYSNRTVASSMSAIQAQEVTDINKSIDKGGNLSLTKAELDGLLTSKTINQIEYQKLALLIK